MPRKETRRNKIKKKQIGAEVKPCTPTQAIDAHMREEEKNRKQKKEQKKQGTSLQPSYLDHVVVSYDLNGSYAGLK